jgi:hypothetical protein
VVFAFAIVAGISSDREPKEEGFDKEVPVKPHVERPLTLGATMNFLFSL